MPERLNMYSPTLNCQCFQLRLTSMRSRTTFSPCLVMSYILVPGLILITLFVLYISYSRNRNRVVELFVNIEGPSLATSPDFKAFLEFQGTMCDMWNEVIEKSMQSDQTTLSKAAYIASLEQAQVPQTTFIQCADTYTATTPIATLLQDIPTSITPYKNTLTFLNEKTTSLITKMQGALQGNIDGFAPYSAHGTCSGTITDSTITCSFSPDSPGSSGSSDPSGSDPSGSVPTPDQINEVIQRAKTINEDVPDIQTLYTTVQASIAKLKEYSGKAQDGTIYAEVNVPPS